MYLLDTHTILWTLYKSDNLSEGVKDIILNEKDLYYSIASLWEIAIKQSLGKLEFPQTIVEIANECARQRITRIDITPMDCDKLKALPNIHGDPFDRIIISQAMNHNLTILSRDVRISEYDVPTVW